MFIIKSTKCNAIVGLDGEIYASNTFGPLGRKPRLYKTRAGAEKEAAKRLWRKVVELDQHGCEI